MKLNITVPQQVDAKEIRLYIKVADMFTAHIYDADGKNLGGQDDGYVADFMPGPHSGDYLILNIDLESGEITNWKTPTPAQVERFITKSDED